MLLVREISVWWYLLGQWKLSNPERVVQLGQGDASLLQTLKGEYGKVHGRDSEILIYNEGIHEGFGRNYEL